MILDGFTVHESITEARVMSALEEDPLGIDEPGFCLACGEATNAPAPDAHRFFCSACGAFAVVGASDLFLEMT